MRLEKSAFGVMRRRPPESLAGQRVLITGGSSGVGLACAERLGRAGARVVLIARGETALEAACRRLPACDGAVSADVRDPAALRAAVAQAVSLHGGRLDAVVANAAAAAYGPFAGMSVDDYRGTIESALVGAVNTAHAVLPALAADGGGTLVFVGSVAARVPVPWLAAYAAAKHGVRGFARSLAGELVALRIPVRIALVNPGPVDTPFWERVRTPDRRLPPKIAGVYTAEDVAAEIELALLDGRRLERTVGGLMAAWAFVDALAPNLLVRVTGPAARLGWRRRERRPVDTADALAEPAHDAERSGDLPSRRSTLTLLRARRR
jgi:NAD(P)-dependent dehydrogenase (short-subunit alcohol dehydrogenase family)